MEEDRPARSKKVQKHKSIKRVETEAPKKRLNESPKKKQAKASKAIAAAEDSDNDD